LTAEEQFMTIAPNHPALAAVPTDDSAVADVTTLLPAREAVLARLGEQLTATDGTPAATLLVIGLLRRDDGWPTPAATVAQVTALLARSLRGEDWLGSSGQAEFVIVMSGSPVGAHTAAHRLVTAIEGLGVSGLSAAAGIAPLGADLTAGEALRRAMLSLTAARRVGPGGVVQLRGPA
jgi:GGDEF domain-containing protein